MTAYEEYIGIGRRLNAATDPAEKKALVTRRKLVRAGLEFEFVIDQIARDSSPLRVEPACKTIEEWRALGRI